MQAEASVHVLAEPFFLQQPLAHSSERSHASPKDRFAAYVTPTVLADVLATDDDDAVVLDACRVCPEVETAVGSMEDETAWTSAMEEVVEALTTLPPDSRLSTHPGARATSNERRNSASLSGLNIFTYAPITCRPADPQAFPPSPRSLFPLLRIYCRPCASGPRLS